MTLGATITVAATVCVALAGYLATYLNNRSLARREARLARINSQLSQLYGPLLADLESGNAAWRVFQEIARRLGPMFWDTGAPPDHHQAALWQLWIRTVFLPTNRRMTECVKANAALLVEDVMPACLVQLAANTAAYDVLVARWADPEFAPAGREDYVAPDAYKFPRAELDDYVSSSFKVLKKAQQDLLGKLGRASDR